MKDLVIETTMSSKGQTVIPKYVRERLEIKQGTKLAWRLTPDGEITVGKVSYPKKQSWIEWLEDIEKLDSSIWEGVDPVEYIRSLRDESEREFS